MCDEPRVWAELGFDLHDDAVQVGRVLIRLGSSAGAGGGAGDGGRGIAGWSLRGVSSAELDGLNTTISRSPPRAPAGAQPNGVLAIDHVVAFSPDFERTLGSLQTAGLELRRVREQPTPAGAPRQAFFRLGEEILELIELPEDRLAVAGGREAPARLWGLAFTVEDLERSVETLGGRSSEIRAAVQPGRRIATLRREAGLSVPVALMSSREVTVP